MQKTSPPKLQLIGMVTHAAAAIATAASAALPPSCRISVYKKNIFLFLYKETFLQTLIYLHMSCCRNVMILIFLFTKAFIFFKHQCFPLQNSSLGQLYTKVDIVPLLVAALEIADLYGLQHVHYTLLDVFLKTSLKGSEKESFV